jgi:hypothetical protein
MSLVLLTSRLIPTCRDSTIELLPKMSLVLLTSRLIPMDRDSTIELLPKICAGEDFVGSKRIPQELMESRWRGFE